MFKIIQSHRTEYLVEELLVAYKAKNQPIFAEFTVIVPSMVIGDWLDKSIASQAGISTLVTTKFWGQYQWMLMQKVLAEHNIWLEDNAREREIVSVPEVAVLTGAVMQWRLFGYFTYYQAQIMADEQHPLHPLLSSLLDEQADRNQQDTRLWSLATDFARVFGRYLNHRDSWLKKWSNNEPVEVAALIKEKDELTKNFDEYAGLTPEWLTEHYIELEAAQRHLWRLLFAAVYEHRGLIEKRFWQIMQSAKRPHDTASNSSTKVDFTTGVDIEAILTKQLHIFTIQQLPQSELNFLQKLSSYMDITLLHYNPSQLFWADIVDKQWLQHQQVINPKTVFLRDYGHTLLSRLGKQSRETFAMLAELDSDASYSNNNNSDDKFELIWQDKFAIDDEPMAFSPVANQPLSLLAHLQQDVLMLEESATQQAAAGRLSAALVQQMQDAPEGWYSDIALNDKRPEQSRQWQIQQYDNSLSIHSCHNLQRQLEVLRGMIGRWLNDKNADGSSRHLSDIVVLLPDVERHHDLINSVFVNGKGQDGLTLPAKVTGVVDKSIRQLWGAISGFYNLLSSDSARFESAAVLDWLMLPPLYESLGLTHEQMSRACELLEQAGFIRGFDEAHLQQTLDSQDYDYRFSFAYALDQLVLGLVMPEAAMSSCLYPDNWQENVLAEKTLPLSTISLADAPIIEALCRVHRGLDRCRHDFAARYKAEEWLNRIENHIIHPFFGALDQTRPMRAIFNAMNGFKSSLRANRHYQHYSGSDVNELTSDRTIPTQDDVSQVEAKLSKVSALTLKLSFMLTSIEDELESQQVSAEPTGVITFGRFGALRNVPFGLVVMLNMDLSEFPNRDRDNRYDLMKAGLAKRGDRFSEDDDNGAFLDALLCARSACWIFYNGQRLTDTHEHLPANPVSELLQFLQAEVSWEWESITRQHQALTFNASDKSLDDASLATNSNKELLPQVQRYLPKLIEQWLITQHPALPFDKGVFVQAQLADNLSLSVRQEDTVLSQLLQQAMQAEKYNQQRTNAPARIWQEVFERLQAQDDADEVHRLTKVKLPSRADYHKIAQCIVAKDEKSISNAIASKSLELLASDVANFDITSIDMQQLYRQVQHPAKHFLRQQQVHIILPEDDAIHQEQLTLSGLSSYTINAQLLQDIYEAETATSSVGSADVNKLLYDVVMPAGVARQSTLNYQQLKLSQQCLDFAEQLADLGITINSTVNDLTANNLLTPCTETMIKVSASDMNTQGQLQIKGLMPALMPVSREMSSQTSNNETSVEQTPSPGLWLNVLPNGARVQHLLRFWLSHIYWQVARKTTEQQVTDHDGRSIWRFNKPSSELKKFASTSTFECPPIAYDVALAELLKWIRFAHIAGKRPLTLVPVYAMSYLEQQKSQKDDKEFQPKPSDFEAWLWTTYGSDTVFETCSQHELWQYLLQNHDAFDALKDGFALAEPLFAMMYEILKPL